MALSKSAADFKLSKWHIMVGIGAAGGLGLAYWYWKRRVPRASSTITLDSITADDIKEPSPLDEAQKYKIQGNILFKGGKYDEAIIMYNRAIEACPEEARTELATYYQNRAAAYENLKKWSSVIADCTKAIDLNSRYEKALMRRAKAEEMIKDWENCLDDITCVCLLQQFQNQSALLMADRVLKELGKKHASEAIKNRQPIIPSKVFIRSYFQSFPDDVVYKKLLEVGDPLGQGELTGFLKAKLAFAKDEYQEIISACTEEINSSESESPYIMEAHSLRASFYFLSGLLAEAQEDLTVIINSDDADVHIKVNSLIKRASVHMQSERLEECLKDFEKAAEIGPTIADVFHHRGQVKLLMEKTSEAMSDFKRAVELNPDFSIAHVQKCYADYRHAMQTQDVSLLMKCLNNFRKGLEKFPNCSENCILFAQVLAEKQDFEEADKLYRKAADIDSTNANILVHRGLLCLQWKGEIDEAINLMRKAIQVDDKCEFAYETLGTVEVQRGNLVIAIEYFNTSISLARTEMELTHLFSLRDAATSQLKVSARLGLDKNLLLSRT